MIDSNIPVVDKLRVLVYNRYNMAECAYRIQINKYSVINNQ